MGYRAPSLIQFNMHMTLSRLKGAVMPKYRLNFHKLSMRG